MAYVSVIRIYSGVLYHAERGTCFLVPGFLCRPHRFYTHSLSVKWVDLTWIAQLPDTTLPVYWMDKASDPTLAT